MKMFFALEHPLHAILYLNIRHNTQINMFHIKNITILFRLSYIHLYKA